MSLTIQQILLDAKKLASKLKEHDSAADALLSGTELVYKQIDAMKQYTEDTNVPTESMTTKAHSTLIAGMQQESKHLRELQMENQALKFALEDYQNALEIIMSKYRSQSERLINESKVDMSKLYNEHYSQIIQSQAEKIGEMTAVMRTVAALDEESMHRDNQTVQIIARLSTENKELREILRIANAHGSTSHIQNLNLDQRPPDLIGNPTSNPPTNPNPSLDSTTEKVEN
ncbi:hypothetical protein WDU94_011038 [Cyamophila willieti]